MSTQILQVCKLSLREVKQLAQDCNIEAREIPFIQKELSVEQHYLLLWNLNQLFWEVNDAIEQRVGIKTLVLE